VNGAEAAEGVEVEVPEGVTVGATDGEGTVEATVEEGGES
jgi:hypothetical protein